MRTRVRFFLPGGGFVHQCRDCTVEFMAPQPDEAQLKKLYSETYYAAWGVSGQQDNPATRSMKLATFALRLALLRRYLQPFGATIPASASSLGSASATSAPTAGIRSPADPAPTGAAPSPADPTPGITNSTPTPGVANPTPSVPNSAPLPNNTSPANIPPAPPTGLHGQPRILDVGCATGYFLEVAEEEGFKPYGVEYSAYAAARARLRFGSDAIFQGTLEQSSFPKGSFTAIALSDLLEHVRSPATTLGCAETLLTAQGALLIMTPDTSSLSKRLMGHRWTHYKPEHLFYFNRRCLTQLAHRCGLRLVHFERSKKALNLAYLYTQFKVYRHWLLTPLVTIAHRLAPKGLRNRNFYFSIGEMVVILKKMP